MKQITILVYFGVIVVDDFCQIYGSLFASKFINSSMILIKKSI